MSIVDDSSSFGNITDQQPRTSTFSTLSGWAGEFDEVGFPVPDVSTFSPSSLDMPHDPHQSTATLKVGSNSVWHNPGSSFLQPVSLAGTLEQR